MRNLSVTEIAVILVIALLVFGPTKLPQLAKSIGQSVREFKKAIRSVAEEDVGPSQEAETPEKSS